MARAQNQETVFNALTEKQISECFRITDRQVRNWVTDGCPTNPDRSFSLYNVHTWLMNRLKSSLESSSDGPKEKKLLVEIELLKLKLQERQSELIPRSEHHDVIESRTRTLRDYLQKNLPSQADHFVGITDRDEVRDRLEQLSYVLLDVYVSGRAEVQGADDGKD